MLTCLLVCVLTCLLACTLTCILACTLASVLACTLASIFTYFIIVDMTFVQETIEEMDKDGDGKVSLQEYIGILLFHLYIQFITLSLHTTQHHHFTYHTPSHTLHTTTTSHTPPSSLTPHTTITSHTTHHHHLSHHTQPSPLTPHTTITFQTTTILQQTICGPTLMATTSGLTGWRTRLTCSGTSETKMPMGEDSCNVPSFLIIHHSPSFTILHHSSFQTFLNPLISSPLIILSVIPFILLHNHHPL